MRMGRRTVRGSWTKGGSRREGNRVEWKGAGRGRTGEGERKRESERTKEREKERSRRAVSWRLRTVS